MHSRLIISLLCAGAIGIACSARGHSVDAAVPVTAQSVDGHPKMKSFLAVEHRHDGVRFALHVVNTSTHRVEIDFPSGQVYDFVVLDSLGREVWQWARSQMFTQSTQIRYVGGGGELEVAENWKRRVPPGRYTAVATLTSTNYPVSERVPFTVR
ncbi:MAG: hypothetical protein KGL38_14820 [Gemmatimonadota bacterium]|nr:hypothetical protein [Gemmatimonadota bacterium]MDE3129280.1 hypothetical protein [Gemmatimonadota bacterium]MDE3172818.1 hypothetical protein [Gemmatimonadota bacterium]MDE3217053.1 hypothetical protein [Gemmatimonadota bacterium]